MTNIPTNPMLFQFYELNTFSGGLDAVLALPRAADLTGNNMLGGI